MRFDGNMPSIFLIFRCSFYHIQYISSLRRRFIFCTSLAPGWFFLSECTFDDSQRLAVYSLSSSVATCVNLKPFGPEYFSSKPPATLITCNKLSSKSSTSSSSSSKSYSFNSRINFLIPLFIFNYSKLSFVLWLV